MEQILIAKAIEQDSAAIAQVHHDAWHREFASMLSSEYVAKMDYAFLDTFWQNYFVERAASDLVPLKKYVPTIVCDLKYTTKYNFTK